MPDSEGNRRGYRFKNQWRTTDKQQLLARDGGCVLCAAEGVVNMGSDGKGKGLIQGHVVPERMGGGNDVDNKVLLCPRHSGQTDGGRRYRQPGG